MVYLGLYRPLDLKIVDDKELRKQLSSKPLSTLPSSGKTAVYSRTFGSSKKDSDDDDDCIIVMSDDTDDDDDTDDVADGESADDLVDPEDDVTEISCFLLWGLIFCYRHSRVFIAIS